MKHLRLYLTAFAAVLCLCANAQSWKGNPVAEGTFYLYNIGTGKWLCGGNDWGTRSSVNTTGDTDFTLTASNGAYTIDSKVSNGGNSHFLRPVDQNAAYVDQGAYEWTFTDAYRRDGVTAYIISCDHGNLSYSGEGTIVNIDLENGTDDNAQWVLVTLEERMATLDAATETNPVDATFLIKDPSFGRNDTRSSYWKMVANDQNFGVPGTGKANNYGCAESWQSAFTMTQEVTVPAGKYKMTAQAALTDYTNAYDGVDYPVVYVNDQSLPFNSMEGGDISSNMQTLSNSFAAGKYVVGPIDVNATDGTLTLGVKGTRTNTWCIWDNFQLKYLGPITDLGPYVEAYEKALSAAKETAASTDKIAPSILSALNSTITANEKDKVDQKSQAALEAATKALNEANEKAKVSQASYKTIAGGTLSNNSLNGWVCTNTNDFVVNTWSNEGDNDGSNMKKNFLQNWVGKPAVLGDGMIYYTLEGLEPGEIFFAQALVRVYSEAGNDPNGPVFFVNDSEQDLTAVGTAIEYNGNHGYYATVGSTATVGADGKLTIGFKISEATYNWVAFKDVSIRSMDDALNEAIKKVEAYYSNLPEALVNETKTFVNEKKTGLSTLADYEAAIQALNNKATELAPISLSYVKYKKLQGYGTGLTAVPSDNASGKSALNSTMSSTDSAVDNATTQEAIDGAYDTLKEAMVTYANASNPTKGNKFNLTFMLVNPDLTGLPTWQKCEGWASEEGDGNSQVMVNDEVKASDGRNAFYEYWSNPAKASNLFSLYQQVDLAKGIYNMSCLAFAKDQYTGKNVRGVKFYANDTEGSTIMKDNLEEASIEFVNTADGTVKIGLKTVEGNTCNWMGIGYVELYKLYNVKEAQLSDNDTAAPAAGAYTVVTSDRKLLKGLNTIVLPFATTQEELGVKQVLRYDGTEVVDDVLRLNFTAVTELSANTPYAVFVEADQTLPSFENKTITEPTDLTVADAEYSFVGTYTAYGKSTSPIVAGDYISGDADFKKAAGGNVIKAYRAYMKKAGDSPAEPTFYVNGVQLDGIQAVEMSNALNEGTIYNLNGQKVVKAQKGVYIINGKKVIVK